MELEIDRSDIPNEWKAWIYDNRRRQVPNQQLLEILIENGFDAKSVGEYLESPLPDVPRDELCPFARPMQKLQALFSIYSQLKSLSVKNDQITRQSNLAMGQFLDDYYSANRPVILTNIAEKWAALAKWSPEYFRKHFGDQKVEVTFDRESDLDYEINVAKHKHELKFWEFVDLVSNAGDTNNFYLVANNHFFKEPGFQPLLNDLIPLPEYISCNDMANHTHLWFGPSGSITPLHHDTMNLILTQLYGRKRIWLIPSYQLPRVYNNVGVFSPVDVENLDYIRFPLLRDVKIIEVVLEPGEALFIPVGWWHQVRSLDISISVSFENFIWPNNYDIPNPS